MIHRRERKTDPNVEQNIGRGMTLLVECISELLLSIEIRFDKIDIKEIIAERDTYLDI